MPKDQAIADASAATGDEMRSSRVRARRACSGRARKPLLILSVALLGILPLAGCSAGQNDGVTSGTSANAARDTPAIHISQTSVMLHNGEPAVARTYSDALAHCSGDVTPLSDDVVTKLGRTYIETSYEGARMSVKADRWNFKRADHAVGCHFEPVHESKLTIIVPGVVTTVDLTAKSAIREDSPGVVREAVAQHAKATKGSMDADSKMRAAVMGELEKTGQSDLVAQDAGSATVAGQPCLKFRSSQGETCMWSGGAKWGFVTDVTATADRMDSPVDNIPLSVMPSDGEGYRMTTESMSVGKPLGDNIFDLPENIVIKSNH